MGLSKVLCPECAVGMGDKADRLRKGGYLADQKDVIAYGLQLEWWREASNLDPQTR